MRRAGGLVLGTRRTSPRYALAGPAVSSCSVTVGACALDVPGLDVVPAVPFWLGTAVLDGGESASRPVPLAALIEEFTAVRRASIALFKSLREEDWTMRGVASDNPVSVRGLAYIVAGHEAHHIAVLQSKYL